MKLILSLLLLTNISWSKTFVPTSFSANFEESMISRATGKEKKSFGKISYKFPGNILFEITSPNPSTFVSNPQRSWYYVPPFVPGEKGQVTIQKSSKLPLTRFLDSLKDGVENSKMFTHMYQGNDLVLTFVKSEQKDMTLKEVILHAKKDAKTIQKLGEFENLTLIYQDGQKVNLRLIEIKEEVVFPPKHFEFIVPKDTKITNG